MACLPHKKNGIEDASGVDAEGREYGGDGVGGRVYVRNKIVASVLKGGLSGQGGRANKEDGEP